MPWMDRKIHQAGVTAVLPISQVPVSYALAYLHEVYKASFHIVY